MPSLFDDMNMVTDLGLADPRVRDTVVALNSLLGLPVIALYRQRTEKVSAPTRRDKNATKTIVSPTTDYFIRVLSGSGEVVGESPLTLDSWMDEPLICRGGSGLFTLVSFSNRWEPIRSRLAKEFSTSAYKNRNGLIKKREDGPDRLGH